MDLERLQEFVLIAEHQNIKKAAEAMNLAPATLNARLSTFEASLETRLFHRARGKLTLTAKGARFYTDACKIVREYRQIKQEIASLEYYTFQSLRIAIVESGMPFHLGPYLDMLNAKNPRLQLEILDDTHYSIADGLRSGQVDLYFAPTMNQFCPDGIARFTLAPSQQYVLLPSEHRLASQESVPLRELDRECFILYPPTKEPCIRDFQLSNLEASGLHYTVYDSHSSPVFGHLFVPIGKGVYISPVPVLNEPPNSVCLPLTDVPYPASSALFYSKNCTRPEIDQFVKSFKHFIQEAPRHENRKAL